MTLSLYLEYISLQRDLHLFNGEWTVSASDVVWIITRLLIAVQSKNGWQSARMTPKPLITLALTPKMYVLVVLRQFTNL